MLTMFRKAIECHGPALWALLRWFHVRLLSTHSANSKLMLEHNSQDKAHTLINNEVFFSGTLEVYKGIQFAQVSWNVFNLVFQHLKIPRVSQGPDFFVSITQKRKKMSSERSELSHYQQKSIHCIHLLQKQKNITSPLRIIYICIYDLKFHCIVEQ